VYKLQKHSQEAELKSGFHLRGHFQEGFLGWENEGGRR